jgi:hypothetical protein
MRSFLLVLAIGLSIPTSSFSRCGVQRWPVKTGTDSDIGSVDLSHATPSRIADLINLAEPDDRPQSNRVGPTETTVVTLDATLTFWKFENDPKSGDSDYHLVLEDANGNSLVGEIPFPGCVGDESPLKDRITAARALFDSQVKPKGHNVHIPVRITGIGFFDLHSQGHNPTGSANNGIEIHPIFNLELNPSAPVQPAIEPVTPTPTPTLIADSGFEEAANSGLSAPGWKGTRKKGPAHNIIIEDGAFPNSGTNYAQFGGFNNLDEVLTQRISIPAGHPQLTFSANVVTREGEEADAFDILTVEARDTNGAILGVVTRLSNQDFVHSNDENGEYFTVNADLTPFAGRTITLAFHTKTDNAATTVFRIDDVQITP